MQIKTDKEKKTRQKFNCSETEEAGKTLLEKLKSFFGKSMEKTKKQNRGSRNLNTVNNSSDLIAKNENNPRFKKFNDLNIKRSRNKIEKPFKSLRDYMKQKFKWVICLFSIYVIIFGAVTSTPIVFNYFTVTRQNETKQERFIA